MGLFLDAGVEQAYIVFPRVRDASRCGGGLNGARLSGAFPHGCAVRFFGMVKEGSRVTPIRPQNSVSLPFQFRAILGKNNLPWSVIALCGSFGFALQCRDALLKRCHASPLPVP